MKCPYISPAPQQCLSCPFDDCTRDERQDGSERAKEWARKNPEKRKAIRRKYYFNHIDVEKKRRREWYLKNKDKALASKKAKREARKAIKCDGCENRKEILDTKLNTHYLCMASMRMINQKCKSRPHWCEKRERQAV